MKTYLIKNARYIALALLALFFLLMSAGVLLESAAGAYFAGNTPLVALAEFVLMAVWSLVGVLLVSRQPRHLSAGSGSSSPLLLPSITSPGVTYYGTFTQPGSLPGVDLAILWNYWTGRIVGLVPLTLLFLVFPTGRPLSRRWGWLAWIAAGAVALYLPLAAVAPFPISVFPFPST